MLTPHSAWSQRKASLGAGPSDRLLSALTTPRPRDAVPPHPRPENPACRCSERVPRPPPPWPAAASEKPDDGWCIPSGTNYITERHEYLSQYGSWGFVILYCAAEESYGHFRCFREMWSLADATAGREDERPAALESRPLEQRVDLLTTVTRLWGLRQVDSSATLLGNWVRRSGIPL